MRTRHLVLLCCCTAVLFIFLGVRALSLLEAPSALAAQQGLKSGRTVVDSVEALDMNLYPLPARIIKIFARLTRGVGEWSARLPGVLGVIGIAALALTVTWRMYGPHAGAVAFAAVCLSIPGIQAARGGAAAPVPALLIGAAWLSWFILGWRRHRWISAWWIALLMVLVAALDMGGIAFLYFYLPLFLLRRPLRAWTQLASLTHSLALAVSLSLFAVWFFWLHNATLPLLHIENVFGIMPTPNHYVARLLVFPLHCGLLFLPWIFFVWPSYCAAFHRLEQHKPFVQYLRSLILPIFLMAWLIPAFAPGHLLLLLTPVGILCGVHYDILVRRHRLRFEKMIRIIAVVALAFGLAAILVLGCLLARVFVISGLNQADIWCGSLLAVTGLALLSAFFRAQPELPVWLQTAAAVSLLVLFLIAGGVPVYSALHGHARTAGKKLALNVPESATVYLLDPRSGSNVWFYLDRRIRRINTPEELPSNRATVYVLAGGRAPIQETRSWEAVSDRVCRAGKSTLRLDQDTDAALFARLSSRHEPPEDAPSESILRMYRGTKRDISPAVESAGN